MARLTKIQSALQIKVQHILQKDVLSKQDVEFVFNHYHEGANNNIAVSGAFSLHCYWLLNSLIITAVQRSKDHADFLGLLA